MKLQRTVPRSWRRAGALGAFVLVACGGRTSHDDHAGSGGSSGDGPEPGSAGAGAVLYAGLVQVRRERFEGNDLLTAAAQFNTWELPAPEACTGEVTALAECCCWEQRLPGLPVAGPVRPNAGDIALTSAREDFVIGLLTPRPDDDVQAGAYATIDLLPWPPMEVLEVTGAGAQVAPFSSPIPISEPFADLSPSLGEEPVVVDPNQALAFIWLPEVSEGTAVSLVLGTSQGSCACFVLDAVGTVRMPAELVGSLLRPPSGEPAGSATVRLERSRTTRITSANAELRLVGRNAKASAVVLPIP